MTIIQMGKEIARDEGILLGQWMGGDSCNANNTADWALTDCTMAFRTDHFGVGDGRGYYRVTYSSSSQHIRKDLSTALTVDTVYRVMIQYRTNNDMQYNGGAHLDLKSSGDGSGDPSTLIPSSTGGGWAQVEADYTAVVASDEMRLLLWLTGSGHTLDWRQFNVYEKL